MQAQNKNLNTKLVSNPIILGIDPGTWSTGYALLQKKDSRYLPIDFGCIRPPSSLSYQEKHLAIFESVTELIEKFSPTYMCFETQYVSNKNPMASLKIGMARASAMLPGLQKGIPIFECSPKEAKKAIAGRGTATKQQVQIMTQRLLNLEKMPPSDAADAIAIAIWLSHSL